jgi:hypothetical protein
VQLADLPPCYLLVQMPLCEQNDTSITFFCKCALDEIPCRDMYDEKNKDRDNVKTNQSYRSLRQCEEEERGHLTQP